MNVPFKMPFPPTYTGPHLTHVSLGSRGSDSISIGSAVFSALTVDINTHTHRDRHTDRHTDRPRSNFTSNRLLAASGTACGDGGIKHHSIRKPSFEVTPTTSSAIFILKLVFKTKLQAKLHDIGHRRLRHHQPVKVTLAVKFFNV